jgi:hypothetical protein
MRQKAKAEYSEGEEAAARFLDAMRHVVTVSHTEIQRRVAVERERSLRNPNKRGPKRKSKV